MPGLKAAAPGLNTAAPGLKPAAPTPQPIDGLELLCLLETSPSIQ